VKVWQPGGHLSEEKGGEVRDWSWRRTRRRLGVLARLTLPYRGRTALALGTLVAYTLVALAPPYLSKLAIDDGIRDRDLGNLGLVVALFLAAALASFLLSIGLWFTDNRQEGLFVGLWVPSILAAGAFWMAAVRAA
jgi:ABC-type multidrug transport system fused ATPase/permease subunit